MSNKPVGVLGAGSFGAVVSTLLSKNRKVYLYTRREEVVSAIKKDGGIRGIKMGENIVPTTNLEMLTRECNLLFPVVRSANFRDMMKSMALYLTPEHMIVHGTKGLDVSVPISTIVKSSKLHRTGIKTMSEVILEESVVRRVGVFSGPNLASEIAQGQLAGTVVASRFDEVVTEASSAFESDLFRVYTSNDLVGVELTGALKNIMAIASGMLHGLGFGENAKALLISRGLSELVWLGKTLGADPKAFLGLAGIGDLVATCSSTSSRNFSVGSRIAQGETLEQILDSMNDVVEGIDTVKVIHALCNQHNIKVPITNTLFNILFEKQSIKEGVNYLMHYPVKIDVDFL